MAYDKKLTKTPTEAPFSAVFRGAFDTVNDAALRDLQRQGMPPAEMPYTQDTDQGLASRRSKHVVRSHAEVAAATHGEPDLYEGLSLRAPMAGQCENDQFVFSTDAFGKQRS